MFHDNLITLRKMKNMTQEDIADIVGVSRQSVAKWETGETVPDLDKCKKLAEIFEVSLDDLANYESEDSMGMALPPKGKHLFGLVTVGDKGQIVIPAKARKIFEISPGDQLARFLAAIVSVGKKSANGLESLTPRRSFISLVVNPPNKA